MQELVIVKEQVHKFCQLLASHEGELMGAVFMEL